MRYSELRQKVRTWFTRRVRIDEWSLDPPSKLISVLNNVRYPANVGLEAPIKDVYTSDDRNVSIGQRVIHVVFPYAVQWRFAAALRIYDLPLDQITALYTNLLTDWIVNGESIDEDIMRIGTTGITESPINVSRIGDASSDWLVTAIWELEIECLFEQEPTPDIQPDVLEWVPPVSQPVSIKWGLWRSKIDELGNQSQSFKDGEVTIAPPPP